MKNLLYKCCVLVEQLKPEKHNDSISLALFLHMIVAFTSPNSWALLRNKSLGGLKPGMQQLCNNIMGNLVQKGFYLTLKVSLGKTVDLRVLTVYCFFSPQNVLIKGTCRTVVTLKPIALTAILTLTIRPLISGNFSENLMTMFLVHIFSVPALIYQFETIASEVSNVMASPNHFDNHFFLNFYSALQAYRQTKCSKSLWKV
jgi:ubiquitin-protein ligase E3 B